MPPEVAPETVAGMAMVLLPPPPPVCVCDQQSAGMSKARQSRMFLYPIDIESSWCRSCRHHLNPVPEEKRLKKSKIHRNCPGARSSIDRLRVRRRSCAHLETLQRPR